MAALDLAQSGATAGGTAPQAMNMPMTSPMTGTMSMPMADSGPLPPQVNFPYGFPQPGDYRIFVQIKRAGRVETGVFDAHVQ